MVRRSIFLALGFASLVLGAIGMFVPLLPTVPFMLLAALCFGKSSPRLEQWLLTHEQFGPHIHAWRESRAISMSGKRAAWAAFAFSALVGLLMLSSWWKLGPLLAAIVGSAWIASVATAPPATDGRNQP